MGKNYKMTGEIGSMDRSSLCTLNSEEGHRFVLQEAFEKVDVSFSHGFQGIDDHPASYGS